MEIVKNRTFRNVVTGESIIKIIGDRKYIIIYSMYKVSNIVDILNGIIVYCMQTESRTSYWFFKTVYTGCVPASDMNNFQFIFNNEQSMSFHWGFSMDSVYIAVQYVVKGGI